MDTQRTRIGRARDDRRGMAKGCLVAGIAALVLLLAAGGCAASMYNGLVGEQEQVTASWSKVENQYKRRYDLVPQLVETVKGSAAFEEDVLTRVTEARASVGRIQVQAETLPSPEQLQSFMDAQAGLTSALARLLAVSERYPELKTTQAFLSLQDQLEGTENRIAVARTDFIEATRIYNTSIRKFPRNFLAGPLGFERLPQFSAEPESFERPEIDFDR